MYWSESTTGDQQDPRVTMVDVVFRISTRELPADHAHELRAAVGRCLPWLESEASTGLHHIQAAPSANGWLRPNADDGEMMQLSKRARLALRVPMHRHPDCNTLEGQSMNVGGHVIEVGASKTRELSASPALFSRHIVLVEEHEDETQFVRWFAGQLRSLGIAPRKLLPGMASALGPAHLRIRTKSMLVADLTPEESLRLQCTGVGAGRTLGCGLFTPHKDIAAVRSGEERGQTD